MNNFGGYITVDEAIKLGDTQSREELIEQSKSKGTCMNCDEDIWKYAGTGLCFSCTTGEADASDDYELVEQKND